MTGGGFSRTDGSLNVRISSQIALFRSPLIPTRQPTAVGFNIPALRVANYASPDDPLVRVMKATRIRLEMGQTWSPEEKPELLSLGTISMGPGEVGTAILTVPNPRRGRREATAIPTPCTPRGQCQRGHFRRLLQTGIAGSGLLWASQLDPQPAWPGPGRGGHCGGRGGSRDMKTGVSERSRTSCG